MSIVFTNQTANGNSLIWPGGVLETPNNNLGHSGGELQISTVGTYNTAALDVEIDQDGLGFNPVPALTQTANGVIVMPLARGARLRMVLSSVAGSTSITTSIIVV